MRMFVCSVGKKDAYRLEGHRISPSHTRGIRGDSTLLDEKVAIIVELRQMLWPMLAL